MTVAELQAEIIRLKKEKNICILAHAYQGHEILEVADYTGDSYGLSVELSLIHISPIRSSFVLAKIIPEQSIKFTFCPQRSLTVFTI